MLHLVSCPELEPQRASSKLCLALRHSKKDTRRTRDTQTIIDSLKAGTADTKIGVVAAKK